MAPTLRAPPSMQPHLRSVVGCGAAGGPRHGRGSGRCSEGGHDPLHHSPLVWPDRAVADQPRKDPQLDRRDSLELHTEAVLSPGEGGQETLT